MTIIETLLEFRRRGYTRPGVFISIEPAGRGLPERLEIRIRALFQEDTMATETRGQTDLDVILEGTPIFDCLMQTQLKRALDGTQGHKPR